MNGKKQLIFLLATAGMELSWLFASGAFLLALGGISPIALLQAPAAFLIGTALTLMIQKGSWRIIYRLGIHTFVLVALFMRSLYMYSFREEAFWSTGWVNSMLKGPQDLEQGMLWAVSLLVLFTFWFSGVCLARRQTVYRAVTARFDVGITAFIILFISMGVTETVVEFSILMLFPFFLISMLAIALARNQSGDARGEFLEKYRGSGPVLAFAVVVLLCGVALVLLFLPYLTLAAEAGHVVIRQYGEPVATFLGRLILIIFGFGRQLQRPAPEEAGEDSAFIDPEAAAEGEAGFWESVFSWGSLALIMIIAAFITGWALFRLWRWLLSGGSAGRSRSLREMLTQWLFIFCSLWRWAAIKVRTFFGRLLSGPKGEEASRYFALLQEWGRWSGMGRSKGETPYEYGSALVQYFPGVRAEIELIIYCFQEEVYGELPLDGKRKRRLRRAWRVLCSPRCWPARFYNRLIGTAGEDRIVARAGNR